jgi:hypothetical protein
MRLSEKSFSPILIVLALLLSAANNGKLKNPRPQRETETKSEAQVVQPREPQVPRSVWQQSQAALNRALDANEQQSIAAQKQADAAKETVLSPAMIVQIVLALVGAGYLYFMIKQTSLARESLVASRRAFVTAEQLAPVWYPVKETGQYNWSMRPVWRNTGATPTKDLILHVECEVRDTKLPLDFSFAFDPTEIGTGVIGPGSITVGGTGARVVTPDELAASQRGEKFIYFWGFAKYFDIYPKSPQHVSHFCWAIAVTGEPHEFAPNTVGLPPTKGALTFHNVQTPNGNYAT